MSSWFQRIAKAINLAATVEQHTAEIKLMSARLDSMEKAFATLCPACKEAKMEIKTYDEDSLGGDVKRETFRICPNCGTSELIARAYVPHDL